MNENSQAILLLTVRFNRSAGTGPTPLTPTEYGRLASWLHKNDREPRDLLRNPEEILSDWSDPRGKITMDRLKDLLKRGMAMGVALEKWQGAGLWILTRADTDYPARLRRNLGDNTPAVLFGAGNPRLLDVGGLAMIGSRDLEPSDEAFAKTIACQAASEGLNVVSGGARGVDKIAMQSALEVEGTAVGVLANDLLKTALSSTWRSYIKNNQLCLLSSYSPDAGFNVGNAMGRNKYIYCLSDFALVVQSAKDKGGTWTGATENLKRKWVRLFVQDDPSSPGLEALVKLGASQLSARHDLALKQEWLKAALGAVTPHQEDQASAPQADLFYALFLEKIKEILSTSEEVSLSDLKDRLPDLTQKQITDWLDRAVADTQLEVQGKERIYSLKEHATAQLKLITDD
jgi:predicted Rossmann fold nucleotide-binding protein DprA/Smf involved in DNA uptake